MGNKKFKYKLVIAYDGTDFHGWQVQPKDRTISSEMEKVYFSVFGEQIKLVGASRTDAGVHALGQVATFISDLNLNPGKIKTVWNAALPKTIHIRNLRLVDLKFNPLSSVSQKSYYYTLFLTRPLPFFSRYGWFYDFIDSVDWEKFIAILKLYEGTHDYGSFCKVEEGKNTVRKIDRILIRRFDHWKMVQIEIRAQSFLRYQIRRMIGYALDVARRRSIGKNFIKEILRKPNPQQELLKAPALGLCLRKIKYKNEE